MQNDEETGRMNGEEFVIQLATFENRRGCYQLMGGVKVLMY
jgi:hypothetical protein